MSITMVKERLGLGQASRSVPWLTVTALAVTMAYGDGFLITTLRGATGAVERNDQPFLSWLVDSTIVVPLFVVAVAGALAVAHWRYGPVLRKARSVVKAGLLVAAAASLVGIGTVVASCAYDYALQAKRIQATNDLHFHATGQLPHTDPSCTGVCAAEQASFELQATAVGYGSAAVVLANLAIVGWVVALRGGRLDARTR